MVSGMKSATMVPGEGWEKRCGCKSFSVEVEINSAGHGARTGSVRLSNVERRLRICNFSSSFNEKWIRWGSVSFIEVRLFAEIDEDVDGRPTVWFIISSGSFGGIGSGQCVVPVTEIISFPSSPNGLARDNSWCVKSLIDWRKLKPVDVDSTSDVFVEAVFERGRVDSLMELFEEFDGRIAKEAGVSSRWSMTVVCPSLRKKNYSNYRFTLR